MAKRMHHVSRTEKKSKFYCGTITAEDQRLAQKRANREAAIASGNYKPVGRAIAHGGTAEQQNRRDRRNARQDAKNWRNND